MVFSALGPRARSVITSLRQSRIPAGRGTGSWFSPTGCTKVSSKVINQSFCVSETSSWVCAHCHDVGPGWGGLFSPAAAGLRGLSLCPLSLQPARHQSQPVGVTLQPPKASAHSGCDVHGVLSDAVTPTLREHRRQGLSVSSVQRSKSGRDLLNC